MALRDIKPTRSELINLKRKIQLSERGYKILKMKRDGLILEFFKILANAKDTRGELLSRYERAAEMMALANTVEGAIGVKSAAFSVKEVPQITLKSKNIMGVVVPPDRIEQSQEERCRPRVWCARDLNGHRRDRIGLRGTGRSDHYERRDRDHHETASR